MNLDHANDNVAPPIKLLRFPELKSIKGIPYTKRHLRNLENAGTFPKRVQLSEHCVMWLESEIDAHIMLRAATRAA